MKRKRNTDSDSFEMLLDAMCNTFGGIIFIALLIALLSNGSTSVSKKPSPPDIKSDQSSTVFPEWLMSCESCKTLAIMISKTMATINNGKKEKTALEKQLQKIVAENATLDATKNELKYKFRKIESKNNTEAINMPFQRKTNKKAVLMAAFNQQFYVISNLNKPYYKNKKNSFNKKIVSLRIRPGGIRFYLIPGKGQPVKDEILKEYLKNMRPDKEYALVAVSQNAFAEFIKIKNIFIKLKIQYNWSPCVDDKGEFTVRTGGGGEVGD